jgi:predicted MFS family arabinose efflux permease
LLIVLERAGKAMRTPARDAMLSHAAVNVGRGWAFGLHEALDQVGAVAGPLAVAWALAARRSHAWAFAMLGIPAALALGVLAAARILYPSPRELEPKSEALETRGLPRVFWLYLAAAGLLAAGYADFALIAFHFQASALVSAPWIAILYAAAMGLDGAAALALGRLYDRIGLPLLGVTALVAAPFAALTFLGERRLGLAGLALWAIGMGAQESVLRAAIGALAPPQRRAAAYGVFHAAYGLCWFAGSAIMGLLYGVSRAALAGFSASLIAAAAGLFLLAGRRAQRAGIHP